MTHSAGGLQRAATGLYEAAEVVGEHIQPAASGFYGAATEGLYGAATGFADVMGRLGGHVHSLVAPPALGDVTAETTDDGDAEVWRPVGGRWEDGIDARRGKSQQLPASSRDAVDVAATLLTLGFTSEQAHAAARRCSSVEAALGWLDKNPGVEH